MNIFDISQHIMSTLGLRLYEEHNVLLFYKYYFKTEQDAKKYVVYRLISQPVNGYTDNKKLGNDVYFEFKYYCPKYNPGDVVLPDDYKIPEFIISELEKDGWACPIGVQEIVTPDDEFILIEVVKTVI